MVTEERRKNDRHPVMQFMLVYDCATQLPMGELVNLSPEGAMIVTEGPVKPSSSFKCRVDLPKKIMGYGNVFFDAECRWCRKNIAADRWESGYRLSLTGIDEYLIQFVSLGFELCEWGDNSIPDVSTVEMANRRKHARFEPDHPLPVYELNSYRQLGTLADLSIGGCRLITYHLSEKEDRLQCRVKLPKTIFQRDYLILKLKCARSRKLRDGPHYDSGFIIEEITREDSAIILHLIMHHAKQQQFEKKVLPVK
jgi:hypothetical protein